MTTIVALHTGTELWIGGDSRVTGSDSVLPASVQKWQIGNGWAVGTSGHTRGLKVLGDAFGACYPIDKDAPPPTAHAIVTALRDAVCADDWNSDIERGPKRYGAVFIFASREGVFDIDECFGVVQVDRDKLWARGSGMDFALGADAALRLAKLVHPGHRVKLALEAAAECDTGTGGALMSRPIWSAGS